MDLGLYLISHTKYIYITAYPAKAAAKPGLMYTQLLIFTTHVVIGT